MRPGLTALLALCCLATSAAIADERTDVIAASGEWAAIRHSESQIAPPDVCMLANVRRHVAFRKGEDGLEMRVLDENWSLPDDVTGTIDVAVASFSKKLKITANTSTQVVADLDDETAQALFEAMDRSGQMTVTVGKAKPINVSLQGSSRAAVAFKHCARLNVGGSAPGSNPFQ